MGGSISFVYCLAALIMTDYVKFKLEADVASQLYTVATKQKPATEERAEDHKADLTSAILSRRSIRRKSYCSHLWDRVVTQLGCCCRRAEFLARSQEQRRREKVVREKLAKELDVVDVVRQLRIYQLVATTLLRRS